MKVTLPDNLLMQVEKPARYTGGELNMIKKDTNEVAARFALCFPDVYEIGMSHLGMRILYNVLNLREDTYCERVFSPWIDMEKMMKENNVPVFSLETHSSLDEFDIIGFTVLYEMCYTNILNILSMSDIPVSRIERGERFPLVIAGGPSVCNPEPLSDFIDLFLLGEGEEVMNEFMELYIKFKKDKVPKSAFLKEVSKIEGIYVPSLYTVSYHQDGTIKAFDPIDDSVKPQINKRIISDFNNAPYPEKPIVPFIDIVHDRAMLELFRGCIRGCRFCQAGYIYRPVREKSIETLINNANNIIDNTGYDEISMLSLSTSDYTDLPVLCDGLIEFTEENKINLSLPSLRLDSFSFDLMEKVQKVRKGGLTFAPEAGTQRLRNVINKGITEFDIMKATETALYGGWGTIKLYFMLGHPTETMEDVEGIAELARKIIDVYFSFPKEARVKNFRLTVSTSNFVPKPHTPFQWEPQDNTEMLHKKQMLLKDTIRQASKRIRYNYHNKNVSKLEAVLARGDRHLGKVILKAFKAGCKFDSWEDHFAYDKWLQAFTDCNLDPDFYACRKREYEEILPWDHINMGVSKNFLQKENEKAKKEERTPDCRTACTGCGATFYNSGVCE